MTTIETRTRIKAYSTMPCPRSRTFLRRRIIHHLLPRSPSAGQKAGGGGRSMCGEPQHAARRIAVAPLSVPPRPKPRPPSCADRRSNDVRPDADRPRCVVTPPASLAGSGSNAFLLRSNASLRVVDEIRKQLLDLRRHQMSELLEAFEDPWADSSRRKTSNHASFAVDAGAYESKNVLHRDHLFLHAAHLADLHDLAASVAQPFQVHDDIDGAGDLRTDCPQWQVVTRHHDERLDPGQGVTGLVGVQGCHRSVVPGVHRLQHVEGLRTAYLSDDQPVRPHPERRDDEISDRDLFAIRPGRPGLQACDVVLAQLQLRSVLDGDNSLFGRDVA